MRRSGLLEKAASEGVRRRGPILYKPPARSSGAIVSVMKFPTRAWKPDFRICATRRAARARFLVGTYEWLVVQRKSSGRRGRPRRNARRTIKSANLHRRDLVAAPSKPRLALDEPVPTSVRNRTIYLGDAICEPDRGERYDVGA